MIDRIKKRTGETVPFEDQKITKAMKKAFLARDWADDSALDGFLAVLTRRVVKNIESAGGEVTIERV